MIITALILLGVAVIVLLLLNAGFLKLVTKRHPVPPQANGYYPRQGDAKGRVMCPNCGNVNWLAGPGGGSFGNIQCDGCLTYYNDLGPFGLQMLEDQTDKSWGKPKPIEEYEEQI